MSDTSSSKSDGPIRELILCFDGTGNTFKAHGNESNILKIFRMLDRAKEERFCYYQPGIGTDITPTSLATLAIRPKRTWIKKAVDLALATSFDKHVIGGYRFLARRWKPGAKIYLFGFSRGAYTARFLNEMIDSIGLISPDNEELIPFVWEAFTTWKFAPKGDMETAADAYQCLKVSRETMCRPVARVHFLGLFDTVNSVAEFHNESDRRPAPMIMRHALSIDERRIKFQPVLFAPHFLAKSVAPMDLDVEEVYFAGDHSDVGGGHEPDIDEPWPVSQIPLMWMVQEAIRAGLTFEDPKVIMMGCKNPERDETATCSLDSAEKALLHDSLSYDCGGVVDTFFWRLLEHLPFRRPKIGPDGNVKVTRWHTKGLGRIIPEGSKIHGTVIDRLRAEPDYRPFNLGLGRKPHTDSVRDIGKWDCIEESGLRQYWVRRG